MTDGYWNHPATQDMLGRVAEHDNGTGCTEEDFIGLVRIGVRFPDLEAHDIDEREKLLRKEGEEYRQWLDEYYAKVATKEYVAPVQSEPQIAWSDEEFEAWVGI